VRWVLAVGSLSVVCLASLFISEPLAAPGAPEQASCARRLTVDAALYGGVPLPRGVQPPGMNGCWTCSRPIHGIPGSSRHPGNSQCKDDTGIWAFDDLGEAEPRKTIAKIRRCAGITCDRPAVRCTAPERAHRGMPGYVLLAWLGNRGWRRFGPARIYQLYAGREHRRRSYNPRALGQGIKLGRPGGPMRWVGAVPLTNRQMARDVEEICKLTRQGVLGLYRASSARFRRT
jgi:hypothetical protein